MFANLELFLNFVDDVGPRNLFSKNAASKTKKKRNSKKCNTKYLSQSTCAVAISYNAPKM